MNNNCEEITPMHIITQMKTIANAIKLLKNKNKNKNLKASREE